MDEIVAKFLKDIWANKEWLFSGIGIFLVGVFMNWLRNKRTPPQQTVKGNNNVLASRDINITVNNLKEQTSPSDSPMLEPDNHPKDKLDIKSPDHSNEISELISLIQSKSIPLSQCMVQALSLARKLDDTSLEEFCRQELAGWSKSTVAPNTQPSVRRVEDSSNVPSFRVVEAFLSIDQINPNFPGWQSASDIFDFMRNESDQFFPWRLFVPESVSSIETKVPNNPNTSILTIDIPAKNIFPDKFNGSEIIYGYVKGQSFIDILEAIRLELIRKLLDSLPPIDT